MEIFNSDYRYDFGIGNPRVCLSLRGGGETKYSTSLPESISSPDTAIFTGCSVFPSLTCKRLFSEIIFLRSYFFHQWKFFFFATVSHSPGTALCGHACVQNSLRALSSVSFLAKGSSKKHNRPAYSRQNWKVVSVSVSDSSQSFTSSR